jgi:hypothetical protein
VPAKFQKILQTAGPRLQPSQLVRISNLSASTPMVSVL